jgi:hypothetical protein
MSNSDDFSTNLKKLADFIINRAAERNLPVSEPAARQLALTAGRVISATFGRKNVRPSEVARELPKLARDLRKVVNRANKIGPVGMQEIHANDPCCTVEEQDALFEITRLSVWADLCELAAHPDNLRALRKMDTKGGPTPDLRLPRAVRTLALYFKRYLAVRVTHTSDPQGGAPKSFFDQFFVYALTLFAPEAATKPRAVEDAILSGLNDLRWYAKGMPKDV